LYLISLNKFPSLCLHHIAFTLLFLYQWRCR
jgi:hypothetical protein